MQNHLTQYTYTRVTLETMGMKRERREGEEATKREGAAEPKQGQTPAKASPVRVFGVLRAFYVLSGRSDQPTAESAAKRRFAENLRVSRFFAIFAEKVLTMAQKNYSSEEARQREKAHQFGQPGGNPVYSKALAVNQREFYRWVESGASLDELKEYAADESKPAIRRNFVKSMLKCKNVGDFFDMTNQTHGMPKQTIEATTLPDIKIVLE